MYPLVKDTFDPRDHYYAPDPAVQPPTRVNLRQENAHCISEIYDQLDTGTCTAAATAAAFWYKEKVGKRDQAWGKAGPSRLFIYWLGRGAYLNDCLQLAWPADVGCSILDAMRGIAKYGVCTEDDWPFDVNTVNTMPSRQAIKKAKSHINSIEYYYRLDPLRRKYDADKLSVEEKEKIGAVVLGNLKSCLAEQYPVIFGLWYYLPARESFDESQTPFVLKDMWNLPDKKFPRHTLTRNLPEGLRIKSKNGGFMSPSHTVLAIGYDDEKQSVLIQNSRGPTWGGGSGTFWMPYSWITDYGATGDFWTIRLTGPTVNLPQTSEVVHQEIVGAS